MLNDLTSQAADLFFARNSGETDFETVREIEDDLIRFIAKVERSELKAGIKAALIRTATKAS